MEGSIHPITDEGRRLAEAHELVRGQGGEGRFICVRLSDGRAEGDPIDVFDTFADLARHWDDAHHAPLCVSPGPMPPAEGTAWLTMMRRLADQGWKLTDPDTPRAVPSLAPPASPRPAAGGALRIPEGPRLDPRFARLIVPHLVPLDGKAGRVRRPR